MDATLYSLYENCTLCPRKCHVNRSSGKAGICGKTSALYVARASLHMWEEPPISGDSGSGTVFFSGCPLHCVYCQNAEIANGTVGREISVERLAEIYFELQQKKANNINLVTPTHYIPHVIDSVSLARKKGLTVPIVYNTSGYETAESISLLKDTVDIFLTDFRYMAPETASLYSKAPDYMENASKALKEMFKITGKPAFDPETGLMKKGIIVRILVLPDHYKEAYDILLYLYNTYGDNIFVSILHQYTPVEAVHGLGSQYDSLKRTLTDYEYNYVVEGAEELGMENVYIQENGADSDSFIPEFDLSGV